jgi:SecD/SecF fusion protein
MFTALFMTRFFFSKWVQNPAHKKLTMSSLIKGTNFNFLKNAKYVYTSCVILILIGATCLIKEGKSIMGMDFTGGFALNIELQEISNTTNYRALAEKALSESGTNSQNYQIRELNSPNNLLILFGTSMELEGNLQFMHIRIIQ